MIEDDGIAAAVAEGIGDAKAYLRIETADEDGLIGQLLGTAAAIGEDFLGQALVVRGFRETMAPCAEWRRLGRTPVRAISGVEGVAVDGASVALPVDGYAIDIDAAGDGWVRVTDAQGAALVAVDYEAGGAADWAGIAAPLRQGLVRLAAHLFSHRDAADDAGPPAAVAALWRPYRRMTVR